MKDAWKGFCEELPTMALATLVWIAALGGLALALPWIVVGIDRYYAWVGSFQ